MTQSDIRALVEGFVSQLEGLIRKAALDSIAASLGAEAPSKGRPSLARTARGPASKKTVRAKPAKPARASRSSGAGGRRSPEQIDQLAKKILTFVKSNPGKRAEHIKAALKIPANHWVLPIAKLTDDGLLTVKGQKRATEYFAKK